MDLDFTPEQESFRVEVRQWLENNVPNQPFPPLDTAEGFEALRHWERTLYDGGWSVITWPSEFGGRDAGLIEWVIFEEEYYRAGAPVRASHNGITLLAPVLLSQGTPEQKKRFLRDTADGTLVWAQAWSEPGAGSDLAAIRSAARRDDDRGGWVVSGQKTWSSRAPFADWGFGLFRTEPDSSRHRGLSYLMFPLDAEGVTVRPIRQLDGNAGFAEVFFDDVFVPDADVLGEPGMGWTVAMLTASKERSLSLRSPGRFLHTVDRLIELWRHTARSRPESASELAAGLVDAWIRAEAYRLYTWQTVSRMDDGEDVSSSGSVNKIFWSDLDILQHELALELIGAGDTAGLDPDSIEEWRNGYLFALAGPIYAGTNEIQREIIAERLLGLGKGQR